MCHENKASITKKEKERETSIRLFFNFVFQLPGLQWLPVHPQVSIYQPCQPDRAPSQLQQHRLYTSSCISQLYITTGNVSIVCI